MIPLIYDIARDFSEGYTVLYSEKDGAKLINKELEEIEVDNRRFFQKYFDLTNGFIVGEDRETFEIMVLDKGFKELFRMPGEYSYPIVSKSGVFIFEDYSSDKPKLIFTDSHGNIKFELNNAEWHFLNPDDIEDYFIIEKLGFFKGGCGVVDSEGEEVVPFNYSSIEEEGGFFICTKKGIFNNGIDIYYGSKKLTNDRIKADFIRLEGEGVLRISYGDDDYYLNKHGQKF